MNDHSDLARGLIAKAESDLRSARLLVRGTGPFDTACFHAQQAVEKYLKAFLAHRNAAYPRTHDLEELLSLCRSEEPGFPVDLADVADLTDYAVGLRYDPEFWPDLVTAAEALSVAERARAAILDFLPPELRA
jgi:HEPN domain-containing protein